MSGEDQNQEPEVNSIFVQKLNARQVKIVQELHSAFMQRIKENTYANGMCKSAFGTDSEELIYTLDVLPNGTANICRSFKVLNSRGFGVPKMDASRAREMHNVLDLFVSTCSKIPRFKDITVADSVKREIGQKAKSAVPPIQYTGEEPALDFGSSPILNERQLKPSELGNLLITGETGAGKTASMHSPITNALLKYEIDGKRSSVMVIDPKAELLAGVESTLKEMGQSDRLLLLGKCSPVNLFNDNDGLDLTSRYDKIKSLCIPIINDGHNAQWQAYADNLLRSILKGDQSFLDHTGATLLEFVARLVMDDEELLEKGPWHALQKLLKFGMDGAENLRFIGDCWDLLVYFAGIKNSERPFSRYLGAKEMADQWFFNARTALNVADLVGSAEIAPLMNFSVRVGWTTSVSTDIAHAVDNGMVIVFQPRASATHDVVGKALSSVFYRCVMERADMERPMALCIDELQRFCDPSPESGIHAFLDRCRAFRCSCVLASQSVAALQNVLNPHGRSSSILDSILINCTTKVCFRTSDPNTSDMLRTFIPPNPMSDVHVVTARPPSSLKTGEYYFAYKGKYGRKSYRLPRLIDAATAA